MYPLVGRSDLWPDPIDKAPHLSISIVIRILSSDIICQLNQFNTNSEAAMLSKGGGSILTVSLTVKYLFL